MDNVAARAVNSCNYCGSSRNNLKYPATKAALGEVAPNHVFRCTSIDYSDHGNILQCTDCGLVFMDRGWIDEQLLKRYQEVEDPTYLHERAGRYLTFNKHIRRMQRITGEPNGRHLLDVGAYVGVFVDVAQEAGWQVEGIEPSRWAVGVARRDGLPVREGTLSSVDCSEGSYDVITFWDVVEHFEDPSGEFERAFDLLRPDGFVVLHTIDVSSLTARMMGARWPFLMEMHLVYFSRRTLRAMLEKIGFEVHSMHTAGRYLKLMYLAGRVEAAFGSRIGRIMKSIVRGLRLESRVVPVNTFDLFTMYGRKPAE